MISQAELSKRVAECERLIDLASDPKMKEVFKHVREVWITLADESPNVSRSAAIAVEKIQPAVEHLLLSSPLVQLSPLLLPPDCISPLHWPPDSLEQTTIDLKAATIRRRQASRP